MTSRTGLTIASERVVLLRCSKHILSASDPKRIRVLGFKHGRHFLLWTSSVRPVVGCCLVGVYSPTPTIPRVSRVYMYRPTYLTHTAITHHVYYYVIQ